MAALTARASRTYLQCAFPYTLEFTLVTSEIVFDGSFIAMDTSTGLVELAGDNDAGDVYIGIADLSGTSGDTFTGDGTAKIKVQCNAVILREYAVTGLNLQTEVGDPVWAANDNDLTLTDPVGANRIGVILDGVDPTAGTADVFLVDGLYNQINPLG